MCEVVRRRKARVTRVLRNLKPGPGLREVVYRKKEISWRSCLLWM
jgi:hypothetical protein